MIAGGLFLFGVLFLTLLKKRKTKNLSDMPQETFYVAQRDDNNEYISGIDNQGNPIITPPTMAVITTVITTIFRAANSFSNRVSLLSKSCLMVSTSFSNRKICSSVVIRFQIQVFRYRDTPSPLPAIAWLSVRVSVLPPVRLASLYLLLCSRRPIR